jgi:hypothetical protein
MSGRCSRRVQGYAIISEDGMLATVERIMPPSLMFDADQRFFEQGLDGVDVVVHGRYSQERQLRSAFYDVFHLTRAPNVRLPGGRPVFPDVPERTPEDILAAHGLKAGPVEALDPAKGLTMVSWRR